MKREFTLITVIFIFITVAHGQINIIPTVGIQASSQVMSDKSGHFIDKTRTGYTVGALVEYKLNSELALESGLMLNTKGGHTQYDVAGSTVKSKTDLFYVDIPLCLKGTYPESNLSAIFGAYMAYGVIRNQKNGNVETENWDNFNRIDCGLRVGFSTIRKEKFVVSAYWNMGLLKTNNDLSNTNITNNSVSVTFGYRLF